MRAHGRIFAVVALGVLLEHEDRKLQVQKKAVMFWCPGVMRHHASQRQRLCYYGRVCLGPAKWLATVRALLAAVAHWSFYIGGSLQTLCVIALGRRPSGPACMGLERFVLLYQEVSTQSVTACENTALQFALHYGHVPCGRRKLSPCSPLLYSSAILCWLLRDHTLIKGTSDWSEVCRAGPAMTMHTSNLSESS